MRRVWILLLIVLVCGFVLAAEPDAGIGGEDVERIEGAVDSLPFDESGDIDFEKYKPFKSRAEERVEAINEYVGPITMVLWGVELTLSWTFIFAFVMWILLIELIVVPVSGVFDFNVWLSLLVAVIVATLAMQGIGKDMVVWMDSLMTQWWIGFVVLALFFIFGFFYWAFMGFIGKKIKEQKELAKRERLERSEMTTVAAGDVARESLQQ